MANLSRHRADGFDLCDQTHCQVLRAATPATDRAAAATTGKVLLYQGAPASVFYSASCGGRTERPSEVWPGARNPEFLPSRDDDACGGTPVWTAALSAPGLDPGAARGGVHRQGASRCPHPRPQHVRAGDRAAAGGILAGPHLGPGPARGDRPHAWLAAHQEHGVRPQPNRRRVSIFGTRLRARRRPVRDRLVPSRRPRADRGADTRPLLSGRGDCADAGVGRRRPRTGGSRAADGGAGSAASRRAASVRRSRRRPRAAPASRAGRRPLPT